MLASTSDIEIVPTISVRTPLRPFLKWAGGKQRLASYLLENLPKSYNRYFEPFLGGGALFFHIQPQAACISDSNSELISCFLAVRDHVAELITHLHTHEHREDYYYWIRDIDRVEHEDHETFLNWTTVEHASRFIYLNKTCFNGLYRVNSRGEFNVPFGDYKNPKIVDAIHLQRCSSALQGAIIQSADFESTLPAVQAGDFVYLDPPYIPVSATSSFTSYTRSGFDLDAHKVLRDYCDALDKRGAYFMLSNSYTTLTLSLYKRFNHLFPKVNRAINSKADKRGAITEVLITNY